MIKSESSRRKFIQSVVGGAAASKLMTLLPHAAFAQGAAPKRLLCVFHPMGYLENSFWPTGEGASFTLGETQQALNPHKSKLLYVDGLMNSSSAWWNAEWKTHENDNEHGQGINGTFTGSWKDGDYAASPSIDQVVANALYAQSPTTFKSISLGLNAGAGSHGNAFFVSSGTPVKPMTSANQAFGTLFANVKVQSGSAPPDNSLFLKQKRLKQRVIDTSRAELKAVCGRIGAAEKQMCDAHLEGINQLETRLKTSEASVAEGCTKPAAEADSDDPQAGIRRRIDLIRSAFACDLSRVATLQIGGADGGISVAGLSNQHATTHAAGDSGTPSVLVDHKKWDTWWTSQWAYLLQQLDSVKEGNGTMLDNTLILFGSDTTTGQHPVIGAGAHYFYRFPIWMAGGSSFAFKTGRSVRLNYPKTRPSGGSWGPSWTYHNALLLAVARSFGLNINAFGTMDQGKGPLVLT